MKTDRVKAVILTLVLALIASIIPACRATELAESYMAIIPKVFHSNSTESLSLALFKGERLAQDDVTVSLSTGGTQILSVNRHINGKGTIDLAIPDIEEGQYDIRVSGTDFEAETSVTVEKSFLVFLETDKPIYKPGQTIHMRVLSLNSELKPVSESVTVEVLDAKGIKIFRKELLTDEYGMADLDLPISTEPNLGVWKINTSTEKGKTQLDIRVEKYVLPKYEVKVELPKEWFLADEPIQGKISAEYSFGKPVKGELDIVASRYVGEWQVYATFSANIDGEADFNLPAVRYVAGVPAAGGMGNVMLDIVVKEKTTGYQEKTSRLLTVSETPLNIQIIPESMVFKPGLPFSFLVITETPDNTPIDTELQTTITYLNKDYEEETVEEKEYKTQNGKVLIQTTPPSNGVSMIVETRAGEAEADKIIEASYSPSSNFIHVEQLSEGIPRIGQTIKFKVYSTKRAVNFYYEVVSRNRVVFTDYTTSSTISFKTTPMMAPSSRLLVYQILPNSEVAADYIPFKVEAEYPHNVKAGFDKDEATPGEEIKLDIETEGEAKVGIAAVDKSVFILAENRLNLQQVFDELERLYMAPQVELHEVSIYPSITTRGATDIFNDAGVIVLSNNNIPDGKEYQWSGQSGQGGFWDKVGQFFRGGIMEMAEEAQMAGPPVPAAAPGQAAADDGEGLAEVSRVRQYFPETWLWDLVITDPDGRVSLPVVVPDTITTWMLRAVAISKEKGLGVAENQLTAFQPFFVKIDLPYSAIRGEEFPVRVAIYNYLEQTQSVFVEIEDADWFDLLDNSAKTVEIGASDVGGTEFIIRPNRLGINELKITARSNQAADAMIKTIIIEPEGVAREYVDNLNISGGDSRLIQALVPPGAVSDSGRAYLTLTSSYLTQTIDGLEELLKMPFGCGEQNMMMFAPDAYITRYLRESGQLKPEIMAKAEKLMITGYQRELTYRHSDGSFSAFGQSDDEGSLWLTAFVLKCFSQAKDLIYIDDSVLNEARSWLTNHQNKDGSFDPIGFVCHQEILGGLTGKEALTAFTAIALMEAGEKSSSSRAVAYLEGKLDEMDDPYTVAITTYALELAGSSKSNDAYDKLMALAVEDENGLHWGSDDIGILPTPMPTRNHVRSADIETIAYATLALIKHGDAFNASRSAKWLTSQRNAYGGYGSTQDTVVTLQALTEFSTGTRADVDLTVDITAEGLSRKIKITQQNYDVLQVIELPVNQQVRIDVTGDGEAIAQVVTRYNLPAAEPGEEILSITVNYDVTDVEVNDLVTVSVVLSFNPPQPMEAGMVVLDVSVPTGFVPVEESLADVVEQEQQIKRYEVAGRKVIFYIENMFPGDSISFRFTVQAMYPVKAKGVSSQAYSYYQPEIRVETLGPEVFVSGQ